jgi:hypothetical protein
LHATWKASNSYYHKAHKRKAARKSFISEDLFKDRRFFCARQEKFIARILTEERLFWVLVNYCIEWIKKGLSHEMDLAFDDPHGKF